MTSESPQLGGFFARLGRVRVFWLGVCAAIALLVVAFFLIRNLVDWAFHQTIRELLDEAVADELAFEESERARHVAAMEEGQMTELASHD